MRLVTFSREGRERIGIQTIRSGRIAVLDPSRVRPDTPAGMNEFLSAGETALAAARNALEEAAEEDFLPAAECRLTAPVPHPGKIICLGHN